MTILGFQASQTDNVIKITPGSHGMQWMSPKADGKLIIDGAGAIFTGTITLPDTLADVDFINFTFRDVPGECFRWSPGSEKKGVTFQNVRFLDYNTSNCGAFIRLGTQSDITTQLSVSRNVEIAGGIIRDATTCQIYYLCKSYGLKFHDNKILGASSPNNDNSHEGLVFLRWSDGEFYNNTVRGGGGNAFRIFPAGLNKARGMVYLHDNYVVDMRKHCAVECNGNYSPAGYNADIFIKNNTFGNLAPKDYHSAGVSLYPMASGSKVYVENNVAFNTEITDIIFTDTSTLPDSKVNNFYFPTAQAAGIDLATGKVLTSSTVYGKAGAWMATGKTLKGVNMRLDGGKLSTTLTYND